MCPAPATPGTCPAPPPTLAMGIPLCEGRENLPFHSGGRGATRPNCCPTGPGKTGPSPLNRTTLPSSRGHTYMQGHTTHTDTCVHPDTSAKHVLHSCAHMHMHALYTYKCVHMCTYGLHVREYTCAFTYVHVHTYTHTHLPIISKGREKRETTERFKNRPHEDMAETPHGAGVGPERKGPDVAASRASHCVCSCIRCHISARNRQPALHRSPNSTQVWPRGPGFTPQGRVGALAWTAGF